MPTVLNLMLSVSAVNLVILSGMGISFILITDVDCRLSSAVSYCSSGSLCGPSDWFLNVNWVFYFEEESLCAVAGNIILVADSLRVAGIFNFLDDSCLSGST
jgi:hypothetical protein